MSVTFRKICALLSLEERKSAGTLLGLMVVGMALDTLGVGLVLPVIALLMQDDLGARYPAISPLIQLLGGPRQQTLIFGGMVGLVFVYLAKNLFLAFLTWRQMRFAFGLQAHLSQRLFAVYLRQPYTFHLQRNSAELIRNAIGEVNLFTHYAIAPTMLIMAEGLALVGIASLLLVVEPWGALIVALVLGAAAWGFHKSTRTRIANWGRARQHHEGLRLQHLQQGLGGAKDVKLLGREKEFLAQYDLHNAQSARMGQLQQTLQQIPRFWLELLAVAGMAILVFSMLGQGRDMAVIVPTVGLFAAAAFRLLPAINRMLGAVQSLRYGLPVINVLHQEFQLAADESVPNKNNSTPLLEKEIRLVDVSYAYPNTQSPALSGLSICIRKGELVGFIGPSGCGKSTLVDLIMGLLSPSAGRVIVDGKDIQRDLRAWQDQVGYVPQSIYLIDDTLRRNVAFGLPNDQIDEAAMWRSIREAQLENFVRGQPEGLDTVVGERGIRLSGGQRQRIGIARALYHEPAVLVLDEATSSLDALIERNVMRAVRALRGAKTIIVVAHRLSTVEHCDRLYRLDGGRVTEEGEPKVLLR